jgi:hypothetical protein
MTDEGDVMTIITDLEFTQMVKKLAIYQMPKGYCCRCHSFAYHIFKFGNGLWCRKCLKEEMEKIFEKK